MTTLPFPDKLTFRSLIGIYRDLLLLEFVKNMERERPYFWGGERYPFTNSILEGVVIRPVEPFFSVKLGKWFSFKVINNEYLLKKGE